MKKIQFISGCLIISFMFTIWALDYIGVGNGSNCRRRTKRIESIIIEGKVEKKYLDKNNHMFETLKLMNNNKCSYIVLLDDESGLYNFIEPEDSLLKDSGILKCRVKRKGEDYYFTIDLGCIK